MHNQVYVCGTFYHLFIAILHSRPCRAAGARTLLLLQDFTPSLQPYAERLREEGWFDHVETLPVIAAIDPAFRRASAWAKAFRRNRLTTRVVEAHFDRSGYRAFLEQADINLFFCLGLSSAYFIATFPHLHIRMLEDGERNYRTRLGALKVLKRRYLYRSFIGDGRDPAVRAIHVQQPERLPAAVRHKGVRLDVPGMVADLPEAERQRLAGLFLGNSPLPAGKGGLLLITQPLSEDRFVDEATKIGFYKDILAAHAQGCEVFVKPHPREETDYAAHLGEAVHVLPKDFPLEILDFLPGVRFDRGVTIWSSALNNLACVDRKVFLGLDYDPRLVPKTRFL